MDATRNTAPMGKRRDRKRSNESKRATLARKAIRAAKYGQNK